jgi:sugar O-acyltransferase (sialic acid O-acetyltransferase NeuD family)
MSRVAIIGGGDLGQLIAHHVEHDSNDQFVGFFDDGMLPSHDQCLGVIDSVLIKFKEKLFDKLLIGIGYRHFKFREEVFELMKLSIPLARFIHSSCYVDSTVSISPGCVLMPGCILDKGVVLEDNVLLNTGCVIAHDSTIGAHSFWGPAVHCSGYVCTGRKCYCGIGTTIIDNISLCDNVQTGAGAVVVSDILEPGLYLGVPAKRYLHAEQTVDDTP